MVRIVLCLGLLAGVVHAGSPLKTDQQILEDGNAVLMHPERVLGDTEAFRKAPPVTAEQRRIIEQIAARSGAIVDGAFAQGDTRAVHRLGRSYRLFVTRAMPDAELKELFALSAERDDLSVSFRGFAPGEKFGAFQRNLQPLLGKIEPGGRAPAVQIDPPKFNEAGVRVAPSLAAYDDGKLVAVVAGVTSIEWLASEIAHGAKGRLPQQGPVVEISEIDVMALMQQRMAEHDWTGSRERAMAGFWKRQSFIPLPRATVPRVRLIDPTITVTQTIKGANGEIVALAGARVNPLDQLPFRQRVVIFDGADRAQVAAVKAYKQEGRRVTFITTQLEVDRGFDHLADLQAEIGAQVTVLTQDIKTRFGVEFVPSVIEAKGNRFEVREAPPTP